MTETGIMQQLYDAEINIKVESFFDEGFSVWFGDRSIGYEGGLISRSWAETEAWIATKAAELYPMFLTQHHASECPVAVKPLEWASEPPYHMARVLGGHYAVEAYEAGVDLTGNFCVRRGFSSVTAAKAAAQADYEQRIWSALVAAPVTAPIAERDDLVERVREEAAYLATAVSFAGPLSVIPALRDCADRITADKAEIARALGYATTFLMHYVYEHCEPVPKWAPLPDLMGVLTQIDNATTATREFKARSETAESQIAALKAERDGLRVALQRISLHVRVMIESGSWDATTLKRVDEIVDSIVSAALPLEASKERT